MSDFIYFFERILGASEYAITCLYSSIGKGCLGVGIIHKNEKSKRGKGEIISYFPCVFSAGLWQIQGVKRARLYDIKQLTNL